MLVDESTRYHTLALHLIPGMGPVRIQRLMEFFATPELVLSAPEDLLCRVPGIGHDLARLIASWERIVSPKDELKYAEDTGADVITLFDDDYPASLRTLYDPPIVLYRKGHWLKSDEKSIAVIGSRIASPYGIAAAHRFAEGFARAGVTVISGLARGIDTAAHKGALRAGGRTLAVIGSGLNCLYPQENEKLAEDIAAGHGAVVSEFPMNQPPSRTTFPLRNRIVSGWSRGVLVIEAPQRSGSLITAQAASDQGRRVYALPGAVDRPYSAGCHELIRNGATLVVSPDQILEEFQWLPLPDSGELPLFDILSSGSSVEPNLALTDSTEKSICEAIASGHDTIDALCSELGLSAMDVTRVLTRLQIRKIITPIAGGRFLYA